MRINKYVREWYDESYDINQEDFYVENAKWTLAKEWIRGGRKNGIITAIICFFYYITHMYMETNLLDTLCILSALTFAYFFYAIRDYDYNDGMGVGIHISMLLFFKLTKPHVTVIGLWLFAIIGFVLYIYLTFVKPISLARVKASMKSKMKEKEENEEQTDRENYKQWESAYKSYRYGLPEQDIRKGDPLYEEAKKLFDGYTATKELLKNRYRMLAKKYHPDNGGDENMFQYISKVYDDLQDAMK